MGLWRRIVDSWKEARARDREVEKQAAIDKYSKGRDVQQREQTRSPRLPPRGDRG